MSDPSAPEALDRIVINPRVWRQGDRGYKQVRDAAEAARLVARAEALRATGVATPRLDYRPSLQALEFAWLQGPSARETLLLTCGDDAPADVLLGVGARLRAMFAPLVAIHRLRSVDTALLALAAHDPFERIRPRLCADCARRPQSTATGAPARDAWSRRIVEHYQRLLGCTEPVSARCLVHGDFHVGQLIMVEPGAVPWLVDLEAMALGEPEADLGNFAAHLLSTPGLAAPVGWNTRRSPSRAPRSVLAHCRAVVELIVTAYVASGGERPRAGRLYRHLRIALLRRALKSHERGQDDAHAVLMLSEHL
ncbi:MAG: hypothetical protein KDK91_17860 [Gammaproteobacteria bacterium]|nr:hypothetical protein [Gammaproteobacteria bacterium]